MSGPAPTVRTSVHSKKPTPRERGFSLLEQVAAITIIGLLVPSLALLVVGLVRLASVSDAEVTMLALARSQIENVKRQPYEPVTSTYSTISAIPTGYAVSTTIVAVKTYTFPAPSATSTLPDEIQEITVVVSCPDCSPSPGALTLKGYKAKRESDVD